MAVRAGRRPKTEAASASRDHSPSGEVPAVSVEGSVTATAARVVRVASAIVTATAVHGVKAASATAHGQPMARGQQDASAAQTGVAAP
jgi:hypothetical protein